MGDIFNYSYYNVIAWNSTGGYDRFSENILEGQMIDMDYNYLLFLKFDNFTSYSIPDIDGLITSLNDLFNKIESPFIILTPRKSAPMLTASEDEFVYSFSCRMDLYNRLIRNTSIDSNISSTQLLFELLNELIIKEFSNSDILIRQIPFSNDYIGETTEGDVIIPHRGDDEFLQKVLLSLSHVNGLSIFVGIDEEITVCLQEIIDQFPKVHFFYFTPYPVGPYVIRNRLIGYSSQDLQFFHDSDDISCRDRFEKISNHMKNSNSEFCGSYELRLDYYNRTIRSIRFPKDVSQALGSGPRFPLLHPTSAITRKSFYECGTLSEERIFANDTKFLLNSFFYLQNISNVDEFLYIRTIHPDSLTTSEETKLGSLVRRKLLQNWNTDFQRIKMGLTILNDSSLIFYPTSLDVNVSKISGSSPLKIKNSD